MASLVRLAVFVRKYWLRGLTALFCLLTGTALSLAVPYIVKQVIDGPLATGNFASINRYVAVILVVALVRGVLALVQTYGTESLAQSVVYDLRNHLYDHLQHLSFSYYDKVQTGELMSRLTADVETLRMVLGWGLVNFAANVLTLVAILAMLTILDWQLTLVAMTVLPLVYWTIRYFGGKAREAYRDLQAQVARLTAFLQENISGIRVVKAFGQEAGEIARFIKQNQENFVKNMASSKIYAYYFPLINLLSGLGVAMVLGYGGTKVALGRLSIGSLVAFNTYLTMLLAPLRTFGRVLNMLQRAEASCERIFEVLDTQAEICSLPGAVELQACRGLVRFNNVGFGYGPGPWVLQDVSFTALPGQLVAIVGMTGSGKSSFINLIPRFYEPVVGTIEIDGQDIRSYTLESLRRQIGVVMQDSFLFSASIRENIAYGDPDMSLAEIKQAARQAAIAGFIESLPDGYETIIGERGIGLSGGQKQRLALARALVRKTPILVLDDTTSNVDTETEHAILQSLEALHGKTTVFVIAQRFSLIKKADLILVLDQGRIVQRGTHEELVSQDGLYRQMFEMQLYSGVG